MQDSTAILVDRARELRDARATLEDALDLAGWPWSWRLSRWVDSLLVLEETTA